VTSEWREMLDVNVLAPAVCAREAARQMQAKGCAGHIININRCVVGWLIDLRM
jgi:NAD(P)-dependent dehydrogenase (short-subunit alcohol dehydrogenase family)